MGVAGRPSAMSSHVQLPSTDRSIYGYASSFLTGPELTKSILLVGSSPEASRAADFLCEDDIVITINHAHKAVPRVTYSVYAGDFPAESKHPQSAELGITTPQYLSSAQRFGGLIYCGASMFYLASYWIIQQFPFSFVKVIGCDMVYSHGETHFYGRGAADPLRKNISLQSLEAKSLRVLYFALKHGVFMCNLSTLPESRLQLPRVAARTPADHAEIIRLCSDGEDMLESEAQAALRLEARAPFDTGVYKMRSFNGNDEAWEYCHRVDKAWLALGKNASRWRELAEKNLGCSSELGKDTEGVRFT